MISVVLSLSDVVRALTHSQSAPTCDGLVIFASHVASRFLILARVIWLLAVCNYRMNAECKNYACNQRGSVCFSPHSMPIELLPENKSKCPTNGTSGLHSMRRNFFWPHLNGKEPCIVHTSAIGVDRNQQNGVCSSEFVCIEKWMYNYRYPIHRTLMLFVLFAFVLSRCASKCETSK